MTRINGSIFRTCLRPALLLLFAVTCFLPLEALAAATAPIDAENPGRHDTGSAFSETVEPFLGDRTAPPIMPGWPQTMGYVAPYAPVGVVLADVDANGDLEVIAGSTNSQAYLWDHDGTLRPGWPVNVGGQIQSKAAAADLDGDGDLEILFAVKSGHLHILHHDGTPLSGWPQPTGLTFGFLSPSVYDLDGDHTPEVLLGCAGDLRVWSADGVPRSGWPQAVSGLISGTLAIGDVTGDDIPEIFAVATGGNLYGFDRDGVPLAGWPAPFGLSSSYAAPSIGNLDGTGTNEICVVGYQFGVLTKIHAYRNDATLLPGFPVTYPSDQTYSCPVLADADGDGDLEIFNAGKVDGNAFYAWDHLGAILPGWPILDAPNLEGSAIVVDFDGLPGMEIAVADNSGPGLIFGYNLDGTVASDFPISKPGISGPNSPEVGDVDQDGDLDMAHTMWNGAVVLWDFPASYDESEIEWGALFHDDWNTNQHGFVIPPADLSSAQGSLLTDRVRLGPAFPNPVELTTTTIPLVLAQDESVRLSVYDVAGRLIRSLHDGHLSRGKHRFEWDGLDERGRHTSAGIYFLNLETTHSGRHTTKIAVIR